MLLIGYFLNQQIKKYYRHQTSYQELMVTLMNGSIYLLIYYFFGLSLRSLAYAILLSLLLVTSLIDYYTMCIPNPIMGFAVLVGVGYRLGLSLYHHTSQIIIRGLLGMLVGASIMAGLMLFSYLIFGKQGMGMGDLKCLGVIGLFLGSKHTLYTIYIAIILGGCYGLVIFIKKRQEIFPFGPFLSLGAMISIIWGDNLWDVYMMNGLKEESGYTLLETVLVLSLTGILLSLLWTNYLSVYRNHLKTSHKAQALEEGQVLVNFINHTLQTYEVESCKALVNQKVKELQEGEEGILSEIILRNKKEKIRLKYHPSKQIMTFQTQEISSSVANCLVSYQDQLLEFDITMTQMAKVRTTANLQYDLERRVNHDKTYLVP